MSYFQNGEYHLVNNNNPSIQAQPMDSSVYTTAGSAIAPRQYVQGPYVGHQDMNHYYHPQQHHYYNPTQNTTAAVASGNVGVGYNMSQAAPPPQTVHLVHPMTTTYPYQQEKVSNDITPLASMKYIGYAKNVTELRDIIGTVAGQRIFLRSYDNNVLGRGAGELMWVEDTTTADDSGSFFRKPGCEKGGWKRVDEQLTPFHFGAAPEPADSTEAMKRYITYCAGKTADFRGATWKISSTLHLTNCRRIISDQSSPFEVSSTNFNGSYVICIGDPEQSATNGRAAEHFSQEGILRVVGDRNSVLNGIYVKASHLRGEHMRAENFKGMGIHHDSVSECTFERLSVEKCGNPDGTSGNDFSLHLHDSTNTSHYMSIQVDHAYDRGFYLNKLSNVIIDNVQAERMYITRDNSTNANHYIHATNCQLNQAIANSVAKDTPLPSTSTTPDMTISGEPRIFIDSLTSCNMNSWNMASCTVCVACGSQSSNMNSPTEMRNCTLANLTGDSSSRIVVRGGSITTVALASGAPVEFYDVKIKTFGNNGNTSFVTKATTNCGTFETNAMAAADTEIASFEALRNTVPTSAGQRVKLISHQANNPDGRGYGGGEFIARLKAKADDGGVIASNGGYYYWERVVQDYAQLTVLDFGAVPSKTIDCAPAVLAMFKFTQSIAADPRMAIGVQFPAGYFSLGNIDISGTSYNRFRFVSLSCSDFGYFQYTKIRLIGADATPALLVQARRTEIYGIEIYGQYDSAPNTRAFFKNTIKGGAYIRISCVFASFMGGRVFEFLDSLDTKIDQVYGEKLYANFAWGGWSYNEVGNWDHATAVELSNFNFQQCYTVPVFDLQRCTQSFLKNGWIEQSEYSLDFANGSWTVDGLNLEGIVNPTDFTYCQLTVVGVIGLQGTSSLLYDNPNKTQWLSANEMGRAFYSQRGAQIEGSIATSFITGTAQIDNTATTPVWVDLGTIQVSRDNEYTLIRIMGANGTAKGTVGTTNYLGNDFGGGELRLHCRRVPGTGNFHDVFAEVWGSNPVSDVRIKRVYEAWVQVYIRLPATSGFTNCFIETTGPSRFLDGTPFKWNKSFTALTDAEFDEISTSAVNGQMSIGTPSAGMFVNTNNVIGFYGRAIAEGHVFNLNGTDYVLPFGILEKLPIGSDAFNREGNINNTAVDNYHGGTASWRWTAGSSGANARNGTLEITTKSEAAAVIRTDILNSAMQFKLVSGPLLTTDSINCTFDFRRADGGSTASCYRIQMFQKDASTLSTKIRLVKRTTAGTTTLSPADSSIYDGQVLKVNAVDGNIKVYVNKVLVWNITDASPLTGGVIGFGTSTSNPGYTVSELRVMAAD